MTAPDVSVVVVGFDMARELPRTVRSLLPPYQTGLGPHEVEIVVVDNGSARPVSRDDFPDQVPVRVVRVDDGGVSPCRAINRGVAESRGGRVAVMIDGARLASPGLIDMARWALRTDPNAMVATLGFHLGPKTQQVSVTEGYDRDEEDRLLASIGWPEGDGHRLFEISALGESYFQGALAAPPETTFLMMDRGRWDALGGFDERFVTLGGGLAGFDFFARATEDAGLILLVGEGTFHQLHYGATTQADGIRRQAPQGEGSLGEVYAREYLALTGRSPGLPSVRPTLYGRLTHPRARALFFPDPR